MLKDKADRLRRESKDGVGLDDDDSPPESEDEKAKASGSGQKSEGRQDDGEGRVEDVHKDNDSMTSGSTIK